MAAVLVPTLSREGAGNALTKGIVVQASPFHAIFAVSCEKRKALLASQKREENETAYESLTPTAIVSFLYARQNNVVRGICSFAAMVLGYRHVQENGLAKEIRCYDVGASYNIIKAVPNGCSEILQDGLRDLLVCEDDC